MKTRYLSLPLLWGLALAVAPATADMAPSPRIAGLIERLGSKKFAERRQASQALDRLGAPALDALRKAVDSDDREVSRLARLVLAHIEKREEATAALASTRVRLVCKDTPVPEAVAALAKQSHYDIQVAQNFKAALAKRKITLDTGDVTFWEALDRLCQKAGLVELSANTMPWTGANPYQLNRFNLPNQIIFPPVRIQPAFPNPVIPRIKLRPPMPMKPAQVPGPRPPLKRVAFQAIGARQVKPAIINAPLVGPVQIGGPMPLIRPAFPVQGVINPYTNLQYQPINPNQIVLADGKPEAVPTAYYGALRIRLKISPAKGPQGNSLYAVWEVAAEPRLQNWSLSGGPRIDQALDDLQQQLHLALPANPYTDVRMGAFNNIAWNPYPGGSAGSRTQSTQGSFSLGESPASLLKILKGRLPARVRTPAQPLITVDHILQAAGKTVRGVRGGSIRVTEVTKDKEDAYLVRFRLEKPAGLDQVAGFTGRVMGGPGMRVWVRANGQGVVVQRWAMGGFRPASMQTSYAGLSLVDAKGQAYQLVESSGQTDNSSMDLTLKFRAGKEHGAPAKLVYTAARTVNLDVPFSFADVKLR
jgi:hypothetical protein